MSKMKRRSFLLTASASLTGLFNGAIDLPVTPFRRPRNSEYSGKDRSLEKEIKPIPQLTLYLFVHPMPRREPLITDYTLKWEKLFMGEGHKSNNVLCLLSNSAEDMPGLVKLGKKYFGDRCIVDPSDNSDSTKALIADDLTRTLGQRGNKGDWNVYEIWTSNNARRWSEGLKKSLDNLGFAEERKNMKMITCGQQWTGCLTKYSCFMSKYMNQEEPPDQRADLSPEAGWPIKAEFIERISMKGNVYLFMFRTIDGRPMAQYIDGMRGVWEPPHAAYVELDSSKVESLTTSPNAYMPTKGVADVVGNTFVADVGDGCHPAVTTLISNGLNYEEFRDSLAKAKIASLTIPSGSLMHPGNNMICKGLVNIEKIPWVEIPSVQLIR